MFHPYQRPGIEPPRHYSATKSTLQRYEESDDSESLYSGASTSTTTHLPPKRKRTRLYPSSYKSGASSGKRPTTKTALSKLRPTDKSTTLGTDHTNKQYYSQSTTSTSGSMERLLEGPTTSTYTVAGQQVTNPSNRQLLVTSSSAAVSTRLRMGYDSTTTHHATRPPQMTMVNNVLSRQLVPTPQWADAAMSNSQVTPICFAPVGSVIAVRTANSAKRQWNAFAFGVVTAHNYTKFFVGKQLFSYVVTFGTPIGDVTSKFAPYYGEVGGMNKARQAVFPELTHDDVVRRREALHTVYARFLIHPEVEPNMIWQKARIISRPDELPIQVRVLEGSYTNIIFCATDLLPYTQESNTAILRGGDEWKKVVIPRKLL